MSSRALFLDRDGTLIQLRHFPSQPSEITLYPGIESGLKRLQAAGFKLIVITNQPGIALGRFTEASLQEMHRHLAQELARVGARLNGIYYCPHHPDGTIPEWSAHCECRKPMPGMLHRAATDHCIDLKRSWFVGDILDDVEAGNRAGCRTVLIDLGTESSPRIALRRPDFVARNTAHALQIIAATEDLGPPPNMRYKPARWREERETIRG